MLIVSVVKYGNITIPMSRVIHIPCGDHRQSSHKILNMAHNVHNDIIIKDTRPSPTASDEKLGGLWVRGYHVQCAVQGMCRVIMGILVNIISIDQYKICYHTNSAGCVFASKQNGLVRKPWLTVDEGGLEKACEVEEEET